MIKPEHQEHLEKHMPAIIDEFSDILREKYKVRGVELHGLTFIDGDGGGGHCTKNGCGPSGFLGTAAAPDEGKIGD